MQNSIHSNKYPDNWRQLVSRKIDFFAIMQVLLDYDERSGRVGRVVPPALHHLRRTLAVCPSRSVSIYLRALGGYRYEVLLWHSSEWGQAATAWIHEDAICVERAEYLDQKEHPIHKIVCLSDLYHKHSKRLKTWDCEVEWICKRLGRENSTTILQRD